MAFKIGNTKRMRVLYYLALKGEARKIDIFKEVWGFTPETPRGWASGTFAQMHKDGRLCYNRHTQRWRLGEEGWRAIALDALLGIRRA